MAHELAYTVEGAPMMAYAGETPWHGIGTRVNADMTAAEALAAAHLGWEVGLDDVFTPDMKRIEGFKVVTRRDANLPLGIVGDGWTPIQNADLAAFAESVVGAGRGVNGGGAEGGAASEGRVAAFHTAGALRGGRVVWFLLSLPHFDVAGDEMAPFFLVANGHDGTRAMRGAFTPVRVVCANTLRAAEAGGKGGTAAGNDITIRHTMNAAERMAEAARVLNLAVQGVARFRETAEALAARSMTAEAVRDFVVSLFPMPDPQRGNGTETERHPRIARARASVAAKIAGAGRGLDRDGVRGTAWAAYNAAAEWFDHDRTFRGNEDVRAENRFRAILMEEGPQFKARALSLLLS